MSPSEIAIVSCCSSELLSARMAPTNAQGWSIPWAPSDASEFLFATGDLSRSLQVLAAAVVVTVAAAVVVVNCGVDFQLCLQVGSDNPK